MKGYGTITLVGLGLLAGTAYLLTRKETAPPPAPGLAPKPLGLPLPSPSSPGQTVASVSASSLDAGLTNDQSMAVAYAVSRETDPQKLVGFADSWGTSAPIASALLRTRAQALGGGT